MQGSVTISLSDFDKLRIERDNAVVLAAERREIIKNLVMALHLAHKNVGISKYIAAFNDTNCGIKLIETEDGRIQTEKN